MPSQRGFPRCASLLALLLLGVAAVGCTKPLPRPNIVILDLDTLRADHLGSYGYSRDTTPHIDALASRGSLFKHNYAQAGWTGPSQTSILTSMYVSVHQVKRQGQVLDPQVPLLAEVLQNNGYATAAFSQLMGHSFRRGFDEYVWRDGEWLTGPLDGDLEPTLEQMQDWVAAQTRPFFLFLHTYQVHFPSAPLDEYRRRLLPDYEGPLRDLNITHELLAEKASGQLVPSDDADLDYIIAMYDAELAHLDDVIGRFLASLDKLGLRDSTLVVVVSDHGEEFGERGWVARHGTLFNEVLHTPLIVAGPNVPAGRVFDQPVRNIDVAPTLLSLAGVEIPGSWQGTTLESIWSGREQEVREVLAEQGRNATLLVDRFKIFRNGHLIDLQQDPEELVNAAPEMPVRSRRLHNRLITMQETLRQQSVHVAGPVELTKAELRQLRTLGYIQ